MDFNSRLEISVQVEDLVTIHKLHLFVREQYQGKGLGSYQLNSEMSNILLGDKSC